MKPADMRSGLCETRSSTDDAWQVGPERRSRSLSTNRRRLHIQPGAFENASMPIPPAVPREAWTHRSLQRAQQSLACIAMNTAGQRSQNRDCEIHSGLIFRNSS